MNQDPKGLLHSGTRVAINHCEIPRGSTILHSRVIHSIKTDTRGNPKYKNCIAVMVRSDPEKFTL